MSVLDFLRRYRSYRLVRPWALSAPILVLLISVPLLRPLRSPDPRMIGDDEQSRLATIQAIVESGTLAIEGTSFRDTRDRIVGIPAAGEKFSPHLYSSQLPMQAALLSGPYWVMHHYGITLDRDPNWVAFWLTLLGVTLPVALAAGLVYRMGRQFELRRPLRAALGLIVVLGSGLISYSTVLNAHAPAAALLLASATCLFHVIRHNSPGRATGWLGLAGLCAALAATIDLPACVFLVLFLPVIFAFRWPAASRVAGVAMYVIGASIPIFLHARLMLPITGDLRPGMLHPELAMGTEWKPDTGKHRRKADAGKELTDDAGRRGRGDAGKEQADDAGAVTQQALQSVQTDSTSPRVASVALAASDSASLPASPPLRVPASDLDSAASSPSLPVSLRPRVPASSALSPSPRLRVPASLSPALPGDDEDDDNLTRWQSFTHGAIRVFGAFFGGHGIFSHFPIVALGIVGVSLIMHRHWPAATKTLAAATLAGALAVIVCCAAYRPDAGGAMFATRWFVVFLPLTLFWAGAWLRRSHRQSSWTIAGVLLAFSVAVSLIGATGPLPRDGFDRYSFAGAWHNLIHPQQAPPLPPVIAQGN
ncbi:MAG TPA: hypothetical protein VG269_08760 [Tepidisphaeraceae bacterium]|jgi:hypothetical protein|nr:hypothetical protein [Tepidisphaeraceae bacterium]